jgi:pyruvate, water dikinase
MRTAVGRRFPSPLAVPAPAGAEGWEELYPPYLLFSEENAAWENGLFWYWDGLHRPDVEYPFDTIMHEAYMMSVSASLSKLFPSPAGKGATSRILNGRLYLANVPSHDEAEADPRAPLFARRAGHYFAHWAELSDNWVRKVKEVTAELEAIEIPELPELEDEAVVLEGRGINSGYRLLAAYSRLVDNLFLVYQYHFEMLPLGYFAQINLREFCLQAFPGISEQAISDLTAGVELMQFRPDEELKRLAARAVELGIGRQVRTSEDPDATLAELGGLAQAREWVAEFESARATWFSVSMGTGLFHHERAWSDDLSVPWTALAGYVTRIDRGETLARPREELLERRDRMTAEYRALLASDADRTSFDESLALARLVGPHLQDHNFYIEHRHHSVFWNKIRAVADRMTAAGVLAERDDLFYLNRWEVGEALYDAVYGWASSGSTRHAHWQATIERRKGIVTALRSWIPQPALGPVPDDLGGLVGPQFGITPEAVERWLGDDDGRPDELRGVPASPGTVEGRVRIVLSPAQIPEVGTGEILVCPATAPAWAPVFAHVGAVVSDVGGTMSHAAILCREYGIPAVLGTGHATRRVATGDLVRVDGAAGTVTILDRASSA